MRKLTPLPLVLISMLFLALAACTSSEDDSCVTAFDCPDGFLCVNSLCVQPVAETDNDQETDDSDSGLDLPTAGDDSELPITGDDSELPTADDDSDLPITDDDSELPTQDDDSELPDEIQGCPNGCSGFGDCDLETGKCVCDAFHKGGDCSECADGYHLEAEDDDEDGNPTVRSCVVNRTCNPNPCNNNGCREEGDTVKCTCSSASHLSGRWCDICVEGYLLSNVDGKCKADCTNMTCTSPQKCGIDYATNEANCNSCVDEFYSGADCKSCDVAHFCGSDEHLISCVVENNSPKCNCQNGYTFNATKNKCVKECDTNRCFKSRSCSGTGLMDIPVTANVEGHGICSSDDGCVCDPGWLTGNSGSGNDVRCGLVSTIETFYNVECTICDKTNPPANYSSTGCPQSLTGDGSLCSGIFSSFCGSGGSCYYEPTGDHKLYCVCSDGYHLDGDKYSGYCTADAEE